MHVGKIYVGIDPGAGGGIAVIDEERNVIEACAMPDSERGVVDVLGKTALVSINNVMVPHRAMLERVSASPGMGIVSVFKFGANFGAMRMALTALNIPFDTVHPATWTRAMQVYGIATSGRFGEEGRQRRDKNISKRRAEELFPTVKMTHAIAEALLLAEYARRVERGSVAPPKPPAAKSKRKDKTSLF